MAHTTTCPACGTTFRVTAEQLLARNGNVRCGRCSHVFNAHESLALDYPPPVVEDLPLEEEPAAMAETVREPVPEAERLPEPEPPPAEPAAIPEFTPAAEAETLPEPETQSAPEPLPEYMEESTAESLAQAEPEPAPELEPEPEPQPEPPPELSLPPEVSVAVPPPKRNLRRLWLAGATLMLLGLVVQDAMYFRTELIARAPGLKPTFEQACSLFGCRVEMPQNADLLSIEASSLEADPANAGIVVLNAVLRNRAGYLQALPLFELTLTDYQDKLVARRVFPPREYLPPEAAAQAGMPANEEIEVKLNIDLGDAKAAGYRVYLFYPSTAS